MLGIQLLRRRRSQPGSQRTRKPGFSTGFHSGRWSAAPALPLL